MYLCNIELAFGNEKCIFVSSRTDFYINATDGQMQFVLSVNFYWFVAFGICKVYFRFEKEIHHQFIKRIKLLQIIALIYEQVKYGVSICSHYEKYPLNKSWGKILWLTHLTIYIGKYPCAGSTK